MSTYTHRRSAGIALALTLGVAAFAVSPASALASSFGSKLNKHVQPSNGAPPHKCNNQGSPCTWVLREGYSNGPGVPSPKAQENGKVKKIKVIAATAGHFRFELAKVKPGPEKAKIVRKGPRIRYQGQHGGGSTFDVETFNVNVPVDRGEYIAIKARKTSALRCSSGGANTLQFVPPLGVGGSFKTASSDDGCWMLIQAIVR